MSEVPTKKSAETAGLTKKTPPTLNIKKMKDYKEKDYDTPCIVIEDASCETLLPRLKEGIVGINRAGILSILNGAVPPTQSWIPFVYRQQEQPVNYASLYPKQTLLLAEINDMLLRHAMSTRVQSGPNIEYTNIKKNLKSAFELTDEHFSDSLSLPTIRLTTPSFLTDPTAKYIWAMKVWEGKINLKEEAFEMMLEALDAEETAKEGESVQYVTEEYDYSTFVKDP